MDWDILLILLIILWVVLPLGLIPAVIVLAVKNSKLRKLLDGSGIEYDTGKISVKERKPLSFSIILIVGVIFVIVAGIVFATSGWRYMSGIAKTVMLMSMSAVFFIACAVSEKKLRLEKTGFAFFLLGGIFLPVSIVGVAYFRLLGAGFSFDENAGYRVFLVMMAVTVLIMLYAGRRYTGSAVVRYVFATITAIEYIAFSVSLTHLIYGSRTDNYLLTVIMLTCGYLVFMIIPSLRALPAQTGFILVTAVISFEAAHGDIAGAVCALLCTVISIVINRKIYSGTAILLFPFTVWNLVRVLTAGFVDEYGYQIVVVPIAVTMAVLAAVSFIVTVPALRKELPDLENSGKLLSTLDLVKLKWIERASVASVFVLCITELFDAYSDVETTAGFLAGAGTVVFLALKVFQFHTNGRTADRSFVLTLGCIAAASTMYLAEPPEIIESLYYCALAELAVLPVIFIWKKHKTAADIVVFVQTAIVLAVYMFCVLDMNREESMINAVVLIGACTLLTIFSFIMKAKKWFILSVLASIITVAFLTEKIWRFSSWWIFLLAVGLIFIIYAGVNEYCRQTGQENPIKSGIKAFGDKVWK